MIDNGWVKLHRKMLEWEWYKNTNVYRVFTHLLLIANHKENKWQGKTIMRGQVITSVGHIGEKVTLSPMQVRTALTKLKSTNEITIVTTPEYSLITINNYDSYQEDNKQSNKRVTNQQQTNNKQITTNKNDKNDKNIYISHEDLVDITGSLSIDLAITQKRYETLKDYCLSNGKTYKDYKATLRNWLRRDIDDGKIKVINSTQSTDPLVIAARKKQGLE